MAGFAGITNLATVQAADDERKRKQALEAERLKEADLKRDIAEAQLEDVGGPAQLLDDIARGRVRGSVDAATLGNAEEYQFLNQQRDRRFTRRAEAAERRNEDLAVKGPSAKEREITMLAPLGRFGDEDPTARASELGREPRVRLAALRSKRDELAGNVSRETKPGRIFTDAPDARGDPRDTMPYAGALADLEGADVPRSAIRREFGGTADDRVLSFSDRPEPGMRHYNNPRTGARRDVGAPGGGLMRVSGGKKDLTPQAALLAGLDEEIGIAARQPLTPEEQSADIAQGEAGWDQTAIEQGPFEIATSIREAVAQKRLDPGVGDYYLSKYAKLAKHSDEGDGPDPERFAEFLKQSKAPAPGQAEAAAKTGGGAVPHAVATAKATVADALQPPPDGPGVTRSPAMAEGPPDPRDELLGGLERPSAQRFEGPSAPPDVAAQIARYGIPAASMAMAPASGGLSLAALFAGGAAGEAAGETAEGAPLSGPRIAGAGAINTVLGKALPAVAGKIADKARGFMAVRGLKGLRGAYGPPLREGIREGAEGAGRVAPKGARFTAEEGMQPMPASARDAAKQYAAEANVTPAPTGSKAAYLEDRLPALRGENLPMGASRAELAAGRPVRAPRQLTGPADAEVLPPEIAAALEGEVVEPMAQLGARGAGEGAKQLVPIAERLGIPPDDLLALIRQGLTTRRQQGIPVNARDTTELLAMLMRAGA